MDEPTPRPWEASSIDFCGRPSEHNFYIVGNVYHDCESESDRYIITRCSTGIAIVVGNQTSGDIQKCNADLICAAVNAWDDPAALRARAMEIEKGASQ